MSSKSSPKAVIALLSLLSCQRGDTVNPFCLGLLTLFVAVSQKHADGGNFQASDKATEEAELSSSRGNNRFAGGVLTSHFPKSINRAEQPTL